MSKRLIVLPVLAGLAIAGVSVHSSKAAPPPAGGTDFCVDMSYLGSYPTRPLSLTYDTHKGAIVYITRSNSGSFSATLPLTVGDEPNPHFDRVYALLMKGFDSRRIERICLDRDPATSPDAELTSVRLSHVEAPTPPDLQRVQVCEYAGHCAGINSYGELQTSR
jgi:hypothetical protein